MNGSSSKDFWPMENPNPSYFQLEGTSFIINFPHQGHYLCILAIWFYMHTWYPCALNTNARMTWKITHPLSARTSLLIMIFLTHPWQSSSSVHSMVFSTGGGFLREIEYENMMGVPSLLLPLRDRLRRRAGSTLWGGLISSVGVVGSSTFGTSLLSLSPPLKQFFFPPPLSWLSLELRKPWHIKCLSFVLPRRAWNTWTHVRNDDWMIIIIIM